MCCYQCCVLMSSFVIIITCILSAIEYCLAQKLNRTTIHKSLTREKVDESIVGFKGEALREECW